MKELPRFEVMMPFGAYSKGEVIMPISGVERQIWQAQGLIKPIDNVPCKKRRGRPPKKR